MELYKKISELPINQGTLIRPRIDAMLETGMQFPAVAVSAGAGFGKTQAVASFLERSDYHSVWFQLTPLDTLPMRFWESFAHTISLHRPTLSDNLKKLGFPDSLYKFHSFLKLFTEELYADNQFVVLVFDDFHLIKEPVIIDFFTYLISSRLENLCMVFITRNVGLPSLIGNPYILTTDDLRFTKEEIKRYFENRGIKISSASELDRIHSYTGGWAIALYFSELQIKKEIPASDRRLIDSQQILFSLIDKEIFSAYDGSEQQFFILLSALNFFPKELLTEIFPQKNALSLLNDNVFVSFDQKADSYYLHQIFLDFLLKKQSSIDTELLNDTLCKAGDWCHKNRYFFDAINYYEQCGTSGNILKLILGFKGLRHSRNDADLFIRYFENFPDEFMRKNIMCRIVYAMFFLNNLEIEKALNQMQIVHAQLKKDDKSMLGEALIGSGLISLALGKEDFAELFKRADALLPNGSTHWGENLRLIEYGSALHLDSLEKGSLDRRTDLIFEGIPHITRVLHGTGYGLEHLASAEKYFLRCEFKEAQKDAYKAIYTAKEKNQHDVIDNALFLLLRIFFATGNISKINDTIKELQKTEQHDSFQIQSVSDIALGWFYSEIGKPEKVAEWIAYGEEKSQPPLSIDKDMLLQIRCLIEKREYFEALALTERLEFLLLKRNGLISLIYVLVYRAVIFYNLDDIGKSAAALEKAYALSKDNGLIMPFIEFGHKTRALLGYFRKQKDAKIPADRLAGIHTKASTYAKRRAYIVSQFSYPNDNKSPDFGLTDRELELLSNMSQGLTRDEIAQSMYLSPHTIKSMLKTVYSKIGAVNAADAVRIAGSLKIL